MSQSKVFLLDASAIVAVLTRERGWAVVGKVLATGNAKATPIALAEAMGTIRRKLKIEAQAVLESITALGLEIVALEQEDALEIDRVKEIAEAASRAYKKPRQLSIADASCLAVGRRLGANVVSSDSYWESLGLEGVRLFPFR